MIRGSDAEAAKARAEALFRKREEFETGLSLARLAAEASRAEASAKIAKLRALRLAEKDADPTTKEHRRVITAEQIRAARRLLGWSYATLAKRSDRRLGTVARIESGAAGPESEAAVLDIQRCLEAAGVEFLDHGQPGVRLRKAEA